MEITSTVTSLKPKETSYFFVLGTIAIIFGYFRLWFGVDFHDEAWYVSTIQQFSLGAKPFIEEFSFQQLVFYLISPLFKIFYHGKDADYQGSILFIRHIYFFAVGLAALTSFFLLRHYTRKDISFAISSIFFLDVYAIPSVSYNTIGRLSFFCGTALLAIALIESDKNPRIKSALSGLALAIATLSYPPLLAAALAFFVVSIFYFKFRRVPQNLNLIAIGVFLLCLGASALMLSPFRAEILLSYRMMKSMAPYMSHPLDKLTVFKKIAGLSILPFMTVFFLKFSRAKSLLVFIVTILLIYLYVFLGIEGPGFQYSAFLTCTVFYACCLFILFKDDFPQRFSILFYLILTPLMGSGLTTALSSANGYSNICVGISPAAIISLAFILEGLKSRTESSRYFKLILTVTIALYCYLQAVTVYTEPTITQLTQQVKSGPYRGLFTTPEKASICERLFSAFSRPEIKKGKTILSYYNFPAGYLFTSLRSNAYSTWIMTWVYSRASFETLLALAKQKRNHFFLDSDQLADVVVRYRPQDKENSGIKDGTDYFDPIGTAIRADNYNNFFSDRLIDIYIKKSTDKQE